MFRSNRFSGLNQFVEKKKTRDPEYEEIGPQRNKIDKQPIIFCELCGSVAAAVRCEKCNGQAFCFSCDDMYHKHPKRSSHYRKALDSIVKSVKSGGVRPPLPPKGSDVQTATPPQPPPRRNKRSGFLPLTTKKEQSNEPGKSLIGSLRRIMGNRPLPATPDQEKVLKNRESTTEYTGTLTRSKTAPSTLGEENPTVDEFRQRVAIPQSILDMNSVGLNKSSMPPMSNSPHGQYPKIQPRSQRSRKLSLQQLPTTMDDKRASMVENHQNSWEKQPQSLIGHKGRSQSISNEQWNQVMALQGPRSAPVPGGFNFNSSSTDITNLAPSKQSLSSMSNVGRTPGLPARGMVSSTSVCDLNSMPQQQPHHRVQPYLPNLQAANSFQQLNVMGYDNQMMWMPPCAACQPPMMYPPPIPSGGMKRAASNISMNLSPTTNDVSGYPWPHHNGHMHHHMPMYPQPYFPQGGGCHQHIVPPMPMRGSTMSIPDTMRGYNRMPSSPAPSTRSMSHRSHKNSKSRSSEVGRKSRNHSRRRSDQSSEDSMSSSYSDHDEEPIQVITSSSKSKRSGLAWQCDHCTFINPGNVHTCGMCSKHPGMKERSNRRGSDRRRNGRHKKTDHEDNASDYDNEKRNGRESRTESRLKTSGSLRSTKSRNKSHRRNSYSPSFSGSNEDEGIKIERQLKDLRITGRRDYDGISRVKDHGSLKREGGSRYRNRRRFQNDRSRTPARSTRSSPVRRSRRTSYDSDENEYFMKQSSCSSLDHIALDQKSSLEGTLVETHISSSKINISNQKSQIEGDSESLELSDCSSEKNHTENRKASEENEKEEQDYPQVFEEMKSEKIEHVEVYHKSFGEIKEPNYHDQNPDLLRTRRTSYDLETDEPSFANTLDGIETLKTNEVADIDPNSQALDDRLSSADIPIHELIDIPVLKYIDPNFFEDKTQMQNISKASDMNDDDDKYSTIKKRKKLFTEIEEPKFQDPEYDDVEKRTTMPDNIVDQQIIPNDDNDVYQQVSFKRPEDTGQESPLEPLVRLNDVDVLDFSSTSSESIHSGHRFTPTSFSSSDALFYSPPDSPELSEKLSSKPTQSDDQYAIEDDLVTALDTIEMDDLRSSRETIRSSFDQLPSSDEAFDYEDPDVKERPSSTGAAFVPSVAGDGTAAYDTLSFQDAVSHPDPLPSILKRSVSEQMLSPRIEAFPDKKDIIKSTIQIGVEKKITASPKNEDDESLLSVKEIIARRKQKAMKQHGLELVQILREAEDMGYNPEDVSVALALCKDKGPVDWLQHNWIHMVDTVSTLASNYGRDRKTNDVGEITSTEAKRALRIHKGNIWDAVTECVENRQKNFNEIYSKGFFKRQSIIKALQDHEGINEEACFELAKSQQAGSIFKKIWAPAEEAMNSVSSLFKRDNKSKLELEKMPEVTLQPPVNDSSTGQPPLPNKDLDDEYDNRSASGGDDSENESSYNDSPGTISESDNDDPNREVSSEFEYKGDFTTPADILNEREKNNIENIFEVTYIGKDRDALYEPSLASNHTYDSVRVKSDTKSIRDDQSSTKSSSSDDNTTNDDEREINSNVRQRKVVAPHDIVLKSKKNNHLLATTSSKRNKSLTERDKVDKNSLESRHLRDVNKSRRQKSTKLKLKIDKPFKKENVKIAGEISPRIGYETIQNIEKKSSNQRDKETARSVHREATRKRAKKATYNLIKETTHRSKDRPIARKIERGTPDKYVKNTNNKIDIESSQKSKDLSSQSDEEKTSSDEEVRDSSQEDSEEKSVSVTTGRMSLSVIQTGDKRAKLDVKSQTIITDMVSIKETSSIVKSHESYEEIFDDEVSEIEHEHITEENLVDPLDAEEAAKIRATGGPVTVQKASFIVGKAIANAMKRESTIRTDTYPPSESRSPTVSPTPPVSESEETHSENISIATSESEDGLLGSLDTIPEEEEISERTESGRLRTPRSIKAESRSKSVSAKSIPPAVASYSGPIFIPNDNQKQSTASRSHNIGSNESSPKNNQAQSLSSPDQETKPDSKYSIKKGIVNKNRLNEPSETLETEFETSTLKKASSVRASEVNENEQEFAIATKSVQASNINELTIEKPVTQSIKKEEKLISPEKSTAAELLEENKVNSTVTKSIESASVESSSIEIIKSDNEDPSLNINNEQTVNTRTETEHILIADSAKNIGSSSTISSTETIIEQQESSSSSLEKPSTSTATLGEQSIRETSKEEKEDKERNVPAMLDRVEELQKRDDPDYQEIQELKEQIRMMRRELENQFEVDEEEDDESDSTCHSSHNSIEKQGPPIEEGAHQIEPDSPELEQLKFDRTVRRLLAEGQATSYEKAELAAQLLVFSFDETDSIQAAEGCSSIYTALQFLQQECELCAGKYPMGKMISMLHCIHRCCNDCACNYFTFQIKTKNIRELRCPFCNEPDLDNLEESSTEYLNNLDILLKNLIDSETHELFQRKLRDWTLMKDPNFKWCSNCSSGFISNPRARKLICPDCKDVTCANCRKQWEAQHDGITCEDFAKWKDENDPENQAEGVAKHLAENGITCPKCRFTYSLAKGGCMHFTCGECKYEFCSGCGKPFRQGAKCSVGPYCERLGLHAHHPRNCLFYLRDKEPVQLQKLLKDHDIPFIVERPSNDSGRNFCKVMEQKETLEGLIDDECGRFTLEGHAGQCRQHYCEYLSGLVKGSHIDPLPCLDEEDLRYMLRRDNIRVPKLIPGELKICFRRRICKVSSVNFVDPRQFSRQDSLHRVSGG